MSKKKNKKRPNNTNPKEPTKSNSKPLETIEVATSLWVLSLVFLTFGNLIMLISLWMASSNPEWPVVDALARVSVLGNSVVSLVSLGLLQYVLRRRPVAPPSKVTIYGVLACTIPIVIAIKYIFQ